MFWTAQKFFFLIGGAVLVGVCIFSLAAFMRSDVTTSEYAESGMGDEAAFSEAVRSQNASPAIPFFAFGSEGEQKPESWESNEKMEPVFPALPAPIPLASPPVPPVVPAPANIFQRIAGAIPNFFTPQQKGTPTLPVVAESDLTITPTGIRDIVGYMERLSTQYRSINFDYKKLNDTLRAGDTYYPSVQELVDAALQVENVSSFATSLHTLREFAAAKIAFEKMIPVTGNGILVSKTVVGMDMLTVQLLDAFQELHSGTMARKDFEAMYLHYKNTEMFYANKLLQDAGLVAVNPRNNIFVRMMEFLGLGTITHAQLSVGGPVLFQTICTCSFGSAIMVGPPVGGNFFLPPVFALFPNFSPTTGHFVLGLYSLAPIPCLQFEVLACIPDPVIPGTQGTVIMLGTS